MKTLIVGAAFLSLCAAFMAGCSQSTAGKGEDWTHLFDGKTLDGWVQRGGKAKYTVSDGVIVGETVLNTPNSFLCTEKEYADFILEVEFLVDDTLNSGIQIRSESKPDYQNGRVHGYQVEIDPSTKPYDKEPKNLLANGQPAPPDESRSWSGGIYGEGKRGWLFNLTKNAAARKAFKHGQWNLYRVEAVGDTIKTWVNGVPAADFKDKPEELVPKGFIALQVHGSSTAGLQIMWRNVRIKVLD
jgi:hypothetical protein